MTVLDTPLPITFFPDFAAATKREEPYTPRALAARMRTVTAGRKGQLPWLKLARFGESRTDKGSLRHDANLVAITGIEGDYDSGAMTFDAALDVLEKQGLAAIIYTSPSHTQDTPRWRVLCPTRTELPPARRDALLGRLNGLFGGIFAGESWTLSQSYYFGSVNHNPSHRVAAIDGDPIDEHDDLDAIWRGKPGTLPGASKDRVAAKAGEEARADAELVRRIVTGEGYHAELCALSGRYVARGMTGAATADALRGMMLAHPETNRDDRWRNRFASIADLVKSAEAKFRTDTLHSRRAVIATIRATMRACATAEAIRVAARAEAERHNLPPIVADDLAVWVLRQLRQGGQHA